MSVFVDVVVTTLGALVIVLVVVYVGSNLVWLVMRVTSFSGLIIFTYGGWSFVGSVDCDLFEFPILK